MRLAAAGFGVLAGHGDLAGELLGGEGLDGATGGSVVGSQNGVNLVLGGGQGVLDDVQGVRGQPVGHGLVGNDLDVARVDQGLDELHRASLNSLALLSAGSPDMMM